MHGNNENGNQILVRKPEGKGPQGLRIDGRIILEWLFKKLVWRVWAGYIWLKIGPSSGLLWLG
jgi:hypothetical protein